MTRRDLLISLLLGLGLAVVLVAGALLLPRGTGEPSVPISDPAPVQQEDRALLGVWAASVGNLDFPSRPDLTADELKNELDDLIDRTAQWGMNAVFLQVRPCADALYASGIFPVSSYLSSSRELPDGFDPLTYAVERAHAKGIEVHAWVNPLRVSTKDALEDLPESSPARQHPDWVVSYADGCLYWNPGVEGVRALVADGVGEILENYAVDGIHFDDYFYPYPQGDAAFADEEAFAASGGEKSLAEWRRENVTALIRTVSERIRSIDERAAFGVAPFAVWQNASSDPQGSPTAAGIETYSDLYADTRAWVQEGLLDYICPQIYWTRSQPGVEFETVYDWWAKTVDQTGVKLLAGHAFYKAGREEYGWDDPEEIAAQVRLIREREGYGGSVFYRYALLRDDQTGAREALCRALQEKST